MRVLALAVLAVLAGCASTEPASPDGTPSPDGTALSGIDPALVGTWEMVSIDMIGNETPPTVEWMTFTVEPDGAATNRARMVRADGTVRHHDERVMLRSENGQLFEVEPHDVTVDEVVRYAIRDGRLSLDARSFRPGDAEPRTSIGGVSVVLKRTDLSPSEATFLGAWSCDSGLDPEITFHLEDGRRVFASFLHSRPSHRGTWQIQDGTLQIQTRDGLRFNFPVQTPPSDTLSLQNPDERWACARLAS